MKLSAGKWLGLRRLADESGLFKIVAVDQRPPIQNFIKSTLGSNEATWDDVAEVKRVLAECLADESSAVLMDPLFAWPAAHSVMRRDHGLMLTLEHADFDETDVKVGYAMSKNFSITAEYAIYDAEQSGAKIADQTQMELSLNYKF